MTIVERDDGLYEKEVAGRIWTFSAADYDACLKLEEQLLRNSIIAGSYGLGDFKHIARYKEAELAAVLASTDSRVSVPTSRDPAAEVGTPTSAPATEHEQSATPPAPEYAALEALTGTQLRDKCRSLGLQTSYTKPVLIEMILTREKGGE